MSILLIGTSYFGLSPSGAFNALPLTRLNANIGISPEDGSWLNFSLALAPHKDAPAPRSMNASGKSDARPEQAVAISMPANTAPATKILATPPAIVSAVSPPESTTLVKVAAVDNSQATMTKEREAADQRIMTCALPGAEKNGRYVEIPTAAGWAVNGYGIRDTASGTLKGSESVLSALEWMRGQGGLSGFRIGGGDAHATTAPLPNLLTPLADGGGDYVMSVAHGVVDLLSVGRGNFVSEMNLWYHSLNSGFRTQITEQRPCSTQAAGEASSVRSDETSMSSTAGRRTLQAANLYVSDGHVVFHDFLLDGHAPGNAAGKEIRLAAPGAVTVRTTISALLGQPHVADGGWNIERARIGNTQTVNLEVVVNGRAVASKPILADGSNQTVTFRIPLDKSSWVALRLMGAAHTNPIFVLIDNSPVRVSRSSIEWNMRMLMEGYQMKAAKPSDENTAQIRAAYQYAYAVYEHALAETTAP